MISFTLIHKYIEGSSGWNLRIGLTVFSVLMCLCIFVKLGSESSSCCCPKIHACTCLTHWPLVSLSRTLPCCPKKTRRSSSKEEWPSAAVKGLASAWPGTCCLNWASVGAPHSPPCICQCRSPLLTSHNYCLCFVQPLFDHVVLQWTKIEHDSEKGQTLESYL